MGEDWQCSAIAGHGVNRAHKKPLQPTLAVSIQPMLIIYVKFRAASRKSKYFGETEYDWREMAQGTIAKRIKVRGQDLSNSSMSEFLCNRNSSRLSFSDA
jgi:hypothetical protein